MRRMGHGAALRCVLFRRAIGFSPANVDIIPTNKGQKSSKNIRCNCVCTFLTLFLHKNSCARPQEERLRGIQLKVRCMKRLLLLCLLCLPALLSRAYLAHFTTREGLSTPEVWQIMQLPNRQILVQTVGASVCSTVGASNRSSVPPKGHGRSSSLAAMHTCGRAIRCCGCATTTTPTCSTRVGWPSSLCRPPA